MSAVKKAVNGMQENGMVRYMKCPRCELNYIDAEKQEYCDVCLKEMKGISLDVDELEDLEDAEIPTEICPVCGENMMRSGEKMCDECKQKAEYAEEEPDPDEDDEWREYLDDETDDTEMDEELGEDFAGEFDDEEEEEEEEEEYESEDEEDMEYVTGDEIYSIVDDEDDEEEDEEKDPDEDF